MEEKLLTPDSKILPFLVSKYHIFYCWLTILYWALIQVIHGMQVQMREAQQFMEKAMVLSGVL